MRSRPISSIEAWVVSSMVLVNSSGSTDIWYLRHTLKTCCRYGRLASSRRRQCSMKWVVVSASSIHTGQVLARRAPAVCDVANGYLPTSNCALMVACCTSHGVIRPDQIGWASPARHACRFTAWSVDLVLASVLSSSIQTLSTAWVTSCFHFALEGGLLATWYAVGRWYL